MRTNPIPITQPKLQIRPLPVDALTANPANARKHPPRQIEMLKNSILQFGVVNPILVGTGDTIIAGHGRLAAPTRAYRGLTQDKAALA